MYVLLQIVMFIISFCILREKTRWMQSHHHWHPKVSKYRFARLTWSRVKDCENPWNSLKVKIERHWWLPIWWPVVAPYQMQTSWSILSYQFNQRCIINVRLEHLVISKLEIKFIALVYCQLQLIFQHFIIISEMTITLVSRDELKLMNNHANRLKITMTDCVGVDLFYYLPKNWYFCMD